MRSPVGFCASLLTRLGVDGACPRAIQRCILTFAMHSLGSCCQLARAHASADSAASVQPAQERVRALSDRLQAELAQCFKDAESADSAQHSLARLMSAHSVCLGLPAFALLVYFCELCDFAC